MRIYSNSFIHYTKNLESLKGILEEGFKVCFCQEEIYSYPANKPTFYMGIPMTCFCDIPLSHTSNVKYAKEKLGIGMKRQWGIKKQLQPVLYYPNKGKCPSTKLIIEAQDAFCKDRANIQGYKILGCAKPMYLLQPNPSLKSKYKNNYIDREWRKLYESQGSYQWKTKQELDQLENKDTGGRLIFEVNDIDFILVKEQDIPMLLDYINSLSSIGGKSPKNLTKDKEALLSKIIRFETLANNI